jgi:hypothetical protein
MDASCEFAEHIFRAADFEHETHRSRARAMLGRMIARPAGTVPATFTVLRERKGAYRFIENEAISWTQLAFSMHAACARECASHGMVIVPIDGSSVAHTDNDADDGVGRVGADSAGGRGIKSMIALAVSVDGVPLGIGAHVLWARPDQHHPVEHTRRPLAEKESRHWTELQQQVEQRLRADGAGCVPFYQLDREADATHVLLRGLERGVLFTVRSNHNRLLDERHPAGRHHARKLREAVLDAPPAGVIYVAVSDKKQLRTPRVARLVVRFAPVPLKLRALWSHRRLSSVVLTAVAVREEGTCPANEEPLDWLLLTSYPVHTFSDAAFVTRAYTLRWMIERLHYAWKSGTCHVEDSQLESFEALAKWATLHLAVAVHRQHILNLARTEPDLPADQVFDRDSIDAAVTLFRAHRKDAPVPGSTPTLGALVDIISRLGGYTGKSSGGPPGLKVFQRGMEQVDAGATVLRMQRESRASPASDKPE